ncbi:hypothetical protein O1D97_17405 [Marinomonas sp. 15G1-11]|uniref:Protein FliT n=1 Tax=Marinomonas phaeophyticola TaxID=3004091 RepID=A0ABT4JYC6_9GAMM|nr:hypothetical protein [Marinomonas sp. 15G1-11]MCZ2723334.1 hypothetical protein [Marinomonas sp. 15G1-11]
MTTKTVADALHIFYELNSAFADAYWETNDINHKDLFFAMRSLLQEELDELHKLSMQDHIYPYEPINPSVLQLNGKLQKLAPEIESIVLRTQTASNLSDLIPSACDLFSTGAA